MPFSPENRRTTWGLLILCSVLFLMAMSISGYAIKSRFDDTNIRRHYQSLVNQRLAEVALSACRDIERLKTVQRAAALKNWHEFRKDAKILGIKVTPALVVAERQALNEQLRNFKPEPCPRRQILVRR